MLAFNEIDNRLTEIIEIILGRVNRSHLIKFATRQNFAVNPRSPYVERARLTLAAYG